MRFEEILPALREGKKVRRKDWSTMVCWTLKAPDGRLTMGWPSGEPNVSFENLAAEDWEIIQEPERVADYLYLAKFFGVSFWMKGIFEIGKQPDGAVLVPGTERTE